MSRSAFEYWALTVSMNTLTVPVDKYCYVETDGAWQAWQARDAEIEALKHDLVRLSEANSGLATEAEKLRAAIEKSISFLEGSALNDYCVRSASDVLAVLSQALVEMKL